MSQLFSQDTPLAPIVETAVPGAEYSVPGGEEVFVLPASFAQQRLWFLEQWEPGVYNISFAVGLSGDLDIPAMERAFREIVRRHEVLRTTFKMVDTNLLQVISPHMPFSVSTVELQMFPGDVQAMKIRRLIKEDCQRPFDLRQGPLLRATFLKMREDAHTLLIAMHHIVSDGWSIEILFNELQVLYAAYIYEQPSPLPDLTIQYADYAVWQREWLCGEVLEKQLNYWKQQLTDLPVLQLPIDHPRPAIQTFRGAMRPLVIPEALTAELRALSRKVGVTLFMTLLGAFQAMLYRYTDQLSISVGVPIAGRTESNLEPLIGCFINTLVLRTDFSSNPTFWELLKRVREVALGAYDHQDIPFEKLVETLQPDRDMSHNPLTQVMFALQNVPQGVVTLPRLKLIPLSEVENTLLNRTNTRPTHSDKKHRVLDENKTAMFDLDLSIWERGDLLLGELKYNTDLFDPQTIDRMQEHFMTLLMSVVKNPMQRVTDLPLLSAQEREQVVNEWNETECTYPREQAYHDYVAEQTERTPDALAVSDEREQLSYRELQRRASRLATHLQAHGVRPEHLVGLYTERDVNWASAVLSLLQTGAVYLPLDPHHPAGRLQHIVRQSGCQLILTTRHLEKQLQGLLSDCSVQLCCLEDLLEYESEQHWLAPHYQDNQLAYVIYTSGSTGYPKGAMVEHAGMLNHLYAKIETLDLQEQDVVAQTASQCFDISVWQLLAAWLVGAQVRIYPEALCLDAPLLLQHLVADGISILEVVPSLLRTLLEESESEKLANLRWLIATGEALPPDLCHLCLQTLPDLPLLNAYGPTECSDDVTHHLIEQAPEDEHEWSQGVPIGKAIGNTHLYVLDKQQQPQPINVCGEIYIGGVGVGRGYIADPVRTAEVFIPDPWSAQSGARLYRTGDLGRFRTDGSIQYLGRIDQQVKLRGYRIELGEIEQVLREYVGVKESVVVVREDVRGNQRLVAYVVNTDEKLASIEEIRQQMRETLPEYMIPTTIVFLDHLPLTDNGKIDRLALPKPEASDAGGDIGYVAPRTELEEQLVETWQTLLGLERVGIYDDFFAIGGHSLLTVRLVTQIEKQFGKRIPLTAIFQGRTIEALAKVLLLHTAPSPWEEPVEETAPQAVAVNLPTEAVLDLDTCPEVWSGDINLEPAAIFLTGATGFLGAFLLGELLQRTSADIYCLVRANSESKGREKLQQALEQAQLWQPAFASRIKPVRGDLAQPLLGLSNAAFEQLARVIDTVYHNGAQVNMVYSYEDMKAPNVLGTKEVIRLATLHKVKPLHYVSTLSVLPHKGVMHVQYVREQEPIDEYGEFVRGGYAQSKWVAEKLVTVARSRGLPVVIYRPGRITGHSQSGVWPSDDMWCRLIKGCIQLGKSPLFADANTLEMTPVDYVSRAIVALSRRKSSLGQAFHLHNPLGVSANDVIGWINTYGYTLQQVQYQEWLEELDHVSGAGATNELTPFLPLMAISGSPQPAGPELVVVHDSRSTLAALSRVSIACPSADARLIHAYLAYMVQRKFLPAPEQCSA